LAGGALKTLAFDRRSGAGFFRAGSLGLGGDRHCPLALGHPIKSRAADEEQQGEDDRGRRDDDFVSGTSAHDGRGLTVEG
jgi:hypothetical protein